MPYWDEEIVEEFPVGTFRGREAVRSYLAGLFAAIPDFHIEAKGIIGEGETVFVRWRFTGTFSGAAWMGIQPNGSALDLEGMMAEPGTLMDRAMIASFNARTPLGRMFRRTRVPSEI